MDDEQCPVCSRATINGRLYCSDACRNLDANPTSSSTAVKAPSVLSPPRWAPTHSKSPPSSFSYHRRASHSIDISASDRESSSASASSLRFTSPPSSLDEDAAEVHAFFKSRADHPLHPAAPEQPRRHPIAPATNLRLQFSRRPSQTNNRTAIPVFLGQHRRISSHSGSALANSPRTRESSPAPQKPCPPPQPPRAAVPIPAVPNLKRHGQSRGSLPAYFGRMHLSPTAMPAHPLVTMTNIDMHGSETSSSSVLSLSDGSTVVTPTADKRPVGEKRLSDKDGKRPFIERDTRRLFTSTERSASSATVRLDKADTDAHDGDNSDIENLVEPLRGRGRTRTRSRPAADDRRVERSPRGRERRMSMRV